MLQQTHRLLFNKLVDHVGKNSSNSVESLVSLTDVLQAEVIEQDLLDDEDSDRLAEFATCFHDAQAERDDLSCEKEVDDL